MSTPQFRVMVVVDAQTRQEVYGQVIQDQYLMDDGEAEASTDEVVRAYLKEFCDGCYIFNNKLTSIALTNSFVGRVCSVTESPGEDEYHIVVRGLDRATDARKIYEYRQKEFDEWAPALAAYRGQEDPRRYPEPQADNLAVEQDKLWWDTFKYTFTCVSMAIVFLFVIRSVSGGNSHTD